MYEDDRSANIGRPSMERRAIVIRGVVQGVGFRPFVYGLAARHQLRGFVKNRSGSVFIEVEGETPALDQFLNELEAHPPSLAKIEELSWKPCNGHDPTDRFQIVTSDDDETSPIYVSPDVATCDACLAELFDPTDRRYLYPFSNCTHCGPRLTIITGAPYDRRNTTMAAFPMCYACRAEYDDPTNRRFHAQPTACADCGPNVKLLDGTFEPVDCDDPVSRFAATLLDGGIGALKGLGGFHLACDASREEVVSKLRQRKARDQKPFAVMVPDVDAAARLGEVGPEERRLLKSLRRPIVLLRKRLPFPLADSVAPGNPSIGVMLPYTPLHHLLLRAVGGIPLVMTSGNRSDEPIVYRDDDMRELSGMADQFLTHNRPIHIRCDDSVTRVVDGIERPLRRSRGDAPLPIRLPFAAPEPILAVGGQLKGTFALGRDRHAFLSHHLGDLDHYAAFQAFLNDVTLYENLFAIRPARLVHDLHPDYATTRFAQKYNVPVVVSGFEPLDLLQGILHTVRQLESGRGEVENPFARAVREEGNLASRRLLDDVFEIYDRKWRGIGPIATSGFGLRPEYADFDAERRYEVGGIESHESPLCISGQVLKGLKKPHHCPAFGKECTPSTPLGATMVSSEGACAAYHSYGRHLDLVELQPA